MLPTRADTPALQGGDGKLWSVAFANFCGLKAPIGADLKPPTLLPGPDITRIHTAAHASSVPGGGTALSRI